MSGETGNPNDVRINDGNIGAIALSTPDVSVDKTAEDRLVTVMRQPANGIVVTDPDGRIEWVNPAFTTITGYRAEEVVGENPRLLKSGRQDELFYKDLWSTISTGKVWRKQLTNRRKDGTLYAEEMTITPIAAPTGRITHYLAIKADITACREAEKDLQGIRQSYIKMLHDFNNLLTVITGYGELLSLRTDLDATAAQQVNEIYRAAKRAAGLMQQLSATSRQLVA